MKKIKKHPLETAAAGMSIKTARRYAKTGQVLIKDPREYRTRKDPFADHWEEIEALLEEAPEFRG